MRPSIWPKDSRSAVLVGLATFLATQIPTTIQEIRDPFVRSCVLLIALALVMWAMYRAKPPDPPTPPPPLNPAPRIDEEPTTIPDRPLRSLYLA